MELGGGFLGEFEVFLFINNFDIRMHAHDGQALSIIE